MSKTRKKVRHTDMWSKIINNHGPRHKTMYNRRPTPVLHTSDIEFVNLGYALQLLLYTKPNAQDHFLTSKRNFILRNFYIIRHQF